MNKALFIIAPADFRDEELFDTIKALEEAGVGYDIASTRRGQATGVMGKKAGVSLLASEANANNYSAVIFVGGRGVEAYDLPANSEVLKIARDASSAGIVLAAICIGPRILANAGVVEGKAVTCFPDEATVAMLQKAGANYTKASVEDDGKIITADGPKSAYSFGKTIAKTILGK